MYWWSHKLFIKPMKYYALTWNKTWMKYIWPWKYTRNKWVRVQSLCFPYGNDPYVQYTFQYTYKNRTEKTKVGQTIWSMKLRFKPKCFTWHFRNQLLDINKCKSEQKYDCKLTLMGAECDFMMVILLQKQNGGILSVTSNSTTL